MATVLVAARCSQFSKFGRVIFGTKGSRLGETGLKISSRTLEFLEVLVIAGNILDRTWASLKGDGELGEANDMMLWPLVTEGGCCEAVE